MFVEESGRVETKFALGDCCVHYMVAIYSYNPIELSPNVDADVSVFGLRVLKMQIFEINLETKK